MTAYSITKKFERQVRITKKVAALMRMFGLTVDRLGETEIIHKCDIEIEPGEIVYITGPSGSGKSVLLNELEGKTDPAERINLNQIELPADKTVIDCVNSDLIGSLKLLSTAGLNDCRTLLTEPANLSDGQKYRFRLAMAIAGGKKFVFADEFCSSLDGITTSVVSSHLHKFAKKHKVTFIVASSSNRVLLELAPDVIVTKELSGQTDVTYKFNKIRNPKH